MISLAYIQMIDLRVVHNTTEAIVSLIHKYQDQHNDPNSLDFPPILHNHLCDYGDNHNHIL
jgi:hypothetical protein